MFLIIGLFGCTNKQVLDLLFNKFFTLHNSFALMSLWEIKSKYN